MLIEKLNEAGGLLGRPVEAAIMDPRSDTGAYAAQAEALLRDQKVAAIFGCWTSASRKQVLPVLAKYDGLLFYPSQYEGEEQSPHVIYTGATPQQQALPAVDHLLGLGRRRFFLLGTDYVYPRTTNAIIRNYLTSHGIGADAVDELYVPFGEKSFADTVQRIRKFAGRDGAIIATLSGDSNVHFFRERARQGLDADILPVMSLSLGEAEMPALAERNLLGHMVAWNYLQSLDTPENRAFIDEWRDFTGDSERDHQRSDGSELDRLSALGAERRRGRHHRAAGGAPRAGRPQHSRAVRLRRAARSRKPASAQAVGHRPHGRAERDLAGADQQGPDRAGSVEPLAGEGAARCGGRARLLRRRDRRGGNSHVIACRTRHAGRTADPQHRGHRRPCHDKAGNDVDEVVRADDRRRGNQPRVQHERDPAGEPQRPVAHMNSKRANGVEAWEGDDAFKLIQCDQVEGTGAQIFDASAHALP